MKVLALYKPARNVPPTAEHIAKMGAFIQEMIKAGVLLATDGRKADGIEMRVRRSGGEITVTDGPFAEAKEVIGGFALLRVESREHLIEVSKRFLEIAGDGESAILEMFGSPDSPI